MEIKIECPWCNQHYSVDESYVGQKVECSVCEKEFVVSKPKESVPKEKPHTTDYFSDYFSKKENANSSNDSLNQNQKKQALIPKRIIPKVIVSFSALVIVLIVLSVVYYTKVIPDKQYRNGLKAYAEKRYDESLEFFQKASEHGHKQATAEINYIYGNNAFKEKRYEDAIEYYTKAVELGHSKAEKKQQKALAEINYQNGKKSFDRHRYEDAVNSFEKAADLGHSEAQLLLGMCYFNGDGIKRDYDEAVKWFRRAAEQNNLQAQFKLGVCYFGGIGVNRREDEALYWLQKAAEQGNLESQIYLGDFYYDKGKTQENFSEALKWYHKASETGIIPDENKLKMAMCMTFQQAYNGDATSQLAVYVAYEGELFGLKQDESEAQKWLVKSANSGNPTAQGLLGAALMKKGNEEEALKWLKKAGEQEDVRAMLLLATYYTDKMNAELRHGSQISAIGVYRPEAEKWLKKLQAIDAKSSTE